MASHNKQTLCLALVLTRVVWNAALSSQHQSEVALARRNSPTSSTAVVGGGWTWSSYNLSEHAFFQFVHLWFSLSCLLTLFSGQCGSVKLVICGEVFRVPLLWCSSPCLCVCACLLECHCASACLSFLPVFHSVFLFIRFSEYLCVGLNVFGEKGRTLFV